MNITRDTTIVNVPMGDVLAALKAFYPRELLLNQLVLPNVDMMVNGPTLVLFAVSPEAV